MHSFTDDLGRAWEITITVAQVKRVRSRLNLDLMDQGLPLQLAADPALLADLLWELVDKTTHPTVDAECFAEGLGGNAIEVAAESFLQELFDFFPSGRRKISRAAYRKMKHHLDQQIDEVCQSIQSSRPTDLQESLELTPPG